MQLLHRHSLNQMYLHLEPNKDFNLELNTNPEPNFNKETNTKDLELPVITVVKKDTLLEIV